MAHLYRRGKVFWISYYLNSKLVQKSLKTPNQRIALSKQRSVEHDLSLGELGYCSQLALPLILETFCGYLKTIRTHKSYKNDISRLRGFFGPICDSLKPLPPSGRRCGTSDTWYKDKYAGSHVQGELLEDISVTMINKFLLDRLQQNDWTAKTANLTREVLHRFFAYAIKHHNFRSRDRRYPNPAAGVDRMRESAPEIIFLKLTDIPPQLKVLEQHPVIHAMVATYIYAGLRREEGVRLTREDVDMEARLIRVRARTVDADDFWQPKTKRNRVVPISDALFEILKAYTPPADCVWFFPSPMGKRWHVDNFSHTLAAINVKAGLDWSCLDYRHTFGSHLAQKGESLYKIAELMGNSPEICRRHYAALIPEKMRDTVDFEKPATTKMPEQTSDPELKEMLKKVMATLGIDASTRPQLRLVTDESA